MHWMAAERNNFDDPSLRAAIRQLRGGDRAAPELRQRIARQLAEGRGASKTKRPASGRWVRLVTGIAAVIMVAFLGYIVYLQRDLFMPYRPPTRGASYAVNEQLLGAMVAMHAEKSAVAGGQPLTAPLSDAAALAAEASRKLERPVPVVQLSGWTMDGATICTIDHVTGAKFHLTHDGQGLSVFSVPAVAYGPWARGNYEKVINGYAIAGTVMGPSLNCVVADAPMDVKQVAALRDQILQGTKP